MKKLKKWLLRKQIKYGLKIDRELPRKCQEEFRENRRRTKMKYAY